MRQSTYFAVRKLIVLLYLVFCAQSMSKNATIAQILLLIVFLGFRILVLMGLSICTLAGIDSNY
jgi:hypothetical protein